MTSTTITKYTNASANNHSIWKASLLKAYSTHPDKLHHVANEGRLGVLQLASYKKTLGITPENDIPEETLEYSIF